MRGHDDYTECGHRWPNSAYRLHLGQDHACQRHDGHLGRHLCDCGRWGDAVREEAAT